MIESKFGGDTRADENETIEMFDISRVPMDNNVFWLQLLNQIKPARSVVCYKSRMV